MPNNDVDRRLTPQPSAGYIYRTSWPVPIGDIGSQLELRLDGVARYIHVRDGAAGGSDPGAAQLPGGTRIDCHD